MAVVARPAPVAVRKSGGAGPTAAGPLRDATLQRNYGNQALAVAAGAPPASAALARATLQGIVQRAVSQRAKASPALRVPTGTVQRLMSADDWAWNTSLWFRTGKSDAFFNSVTDKLRTYEGTLKGRSAAEKMEHLRALYMDLDQWALLPDSAESSRIGNVRSLMAEIRTELLVLQKAAPEAVLASKENLANTAPTSGARPSRPIKPLSDAQKAALLIVEATGLADARKAHARDMIRNPESIEQAAFGVCGLTSILYAVAKASPRRFAEMIRDAWANTDLVKAWLPVFHLNATPAQQQVHAEVEYITAQWLLRHSASGRVRQNVIEPSDQKSPVTKEKELSAVIAKQREFSDSFEIQGWENVKGHFALTSGGVNYLVNALGTGKPAYKIKIDDFGNDYAVARSKAGSSGSVLASVIETDFYRKRGAPVDTAFVKTRKPKYVHWVVINDAKRDGDYFKINLWTWANTYNATVKADVINTYIYSFVVAEAET